MSRRIRISLSAAYAYAYLDATREKLRVWRRRGCGYRRRRSCLRMARFRPWSLLGARGGLFLWRWCPAAANGAEVLTQIPAKDGAIWLQRGSYQKVTAASFNLTLFDET
jgi:hypothetical protein